MVVAAAGVLAQMLLIGRYERPMVDVLLAGQLVPVLLDAPWRTGCRGGLCPILSSVGRSSRRAGLMSLPGVLVRGRQQHVTASRRCFATLIAARGSTDAGVLGWLGTRGDRR